MRTGLNNESAIMQRQSCRASLRFSHQFCPEPLVESTSRFKHLLLCWSLVIITSKYLTHFNLYIRNTCTGTSLISLKFTLDNIEIRGRSSREHLSQRPSEPKIVASPTRTKRCKNIRVISQDAVTTPPELCTEQPARSWSTALYVTGCANRRFGP